VIDLSPLFIPVRSRERSQGGSPVQKCTWLWFSGFMQIIRSGYLFNRTACNRSFSFI